MSQMVIGYRLSPRQRAIARRPARHDSVPALVQGWVEIASNGDARLIEDAVRSVLANQDICRATLRPMNGAEPVMVIGDLERTWRFENHPVVYDLDAESLRLLRDDAWTIDLESGPTIATRLVADGASRRRLLVTTAAMFADRAIVRLIADGIARYLSGFRGDAGDALKRVQYPDVVAWIEDLRASPEAVAAASVWRNVAPGAAFSEPRGSQTPVETSVAHIRLAPRVLDGVLRAQLQACARDAHVSVAGLLVAATHIAVWRSSDEAVATIGVAFDGRRFPELQDAIGPLNQCVPLQTRFAPDETVACSRTIAARYDEMFGVQECFGLEEQSAGGFDARCCPIITSVTHLHVLDATYDAFDSVVVVDDAERCCCRIDWAIAAGDVTLQLYFDRSSFTDIRAGFIADRVITTVEGIVSGAELPIDRLNVLSEAERTYVTQTVNPRPTISAEDATLEQIIASAVAANADAPAIVAGDRLVTFAEFDRRADSIADRLIESRVTVESRVFVCLEHEADLPCVLLGILKAGAAYVLADPSWPAARLRWCLGNARPALVITRGHLAGRLDDSGFIFDIDTFDWKRSVNPAPRGAVAANPERLAYILYTSGSTGQAKGVMVQHSALANYVRWASGEYLRMRGSITPLVSSAAYDLSVTSLWAPLAAGLAVAFPMVHRGIVDIEQLARVPGPWGCLKVTPSHVRMFDESGVLETLPAPESLVIGGEALRFETVRRIQDIWPATRIYNEYGPTETVVGCSLYQVRGTDNAAGDVPIGVPFAGARIYVLDEYLEPSALGAVGELWVGGAGVCRGYVDQPAHTAAHFIPDPFAVPGARMYRTGDYARRGADGCLEYYGRRDRQVKIKGFRVELGEIEEALRAISPVGDAVVVPTAREDTIELHAYVVGTAGSVALAAAVRAQLQGVLPAFMVPETITVLDRFPIAASGKVDLARLPEPHRQAAVTEAASLRGEAAVLAALFASVLKVERVGLDDSFFDVGGDSMRSIQLTARARKLGFTFRVEDVLRHQTVQALLEAQSSTEEPEPPPPFSLVAVEDRDNLPAAAEDAYPLTQLQLGMLFETQFERSTPSYREVFAYRVRGPLDVVLLERVLRLVTGRHPVLRSTFDVTSYSEPLQIVCCNTRPRLEYTDLSGSSASDQQAWVEQRCADLRAGVIDQAVPAPVHFEVCRLGSHEWQLLLAFHHALLDGWSTASLLAELSREYVDALAGHLREAPLPSLWSFRDFVAREKEALRSPPAADFWRVCLSDCTVLTPPGARRGVDSGRREQIERDVSPELLAQLRQAARRAGVPLKHIFLAAHVAALSRWTDMSDVLTGLVTHARPAAEGADEALGLFLNTVPFRVSLSPSITWTELCQRVARTEVEVAPFVTYPLASIQREVQTSPLFHVAFNYVHFHVLDGVHDLQELRIVDAVGLEATEIPLSVHVQLAVGGRRAAIVFAHNPELIAAEDLAMFAELLGAALQHLVAGMDTCWRWSVAARAVEAERPTETSSALEMEFVAVHELVRAQSRRTPDAAAIMCGDACVTYAELERAVSQAAHRLRRAGAAPETRIGVLMTPGLGQVVAVLAILRSGAAFIPLDHSWPGARIGTAIEQSRMFALVADPSLHDQRVPDSCRVIRLQDEIDDRNVSPADGASGCISGEQLACLMFTSGSTGVPKAVMVSHANLTRSTQARRVWYGDPVERLMLVSSLAFDSTIGALFWTLSTGGTVVFPEAAGREHLDRLAADVRDRHITHIAATPTLYAALDRVESFPALRLVITGGEPCSREWIRAWMTRCPNARLSNEYGPTEATVWATAAWCAPEMTVVPIGVAVPGCTVSVLDAAMQPVSVGSLGELYIGGAGVTRGYADDAAATAEKFVPDPWSVLPGARLYRTGDWGRRRLDGQLELHGRRDDQVKIRGHRIEPREVVEALLALPTVREAAVDCCQYAGRNELIAFVTSDAATPVDTAAIRARLQRQLPAYLLPVSVLALPSMPRTSSGKLDRPALRRLAAEPPAGSHQRATADALDPDQELMKAIWSEVLHTTAIRLDSNFFDGGGDSLSALRVAARASDAFGVNVPVRALFDAPTLRELVNDVQARRPGATPVPAGRGTVPRPPRIPLSFAQERLWFLDQLLPDNPAYNVPLAVRVCGELDVEMLEASLNDVIARHESLRTIFPSHESTVEQLVLPHLSIRLPVIEVSDQGATDLGVYAEEERQQPFDLARGPLLRGRVLRLSREEAVVLLTVHHIVTDGWSMGLLIDELSRCFAARRAAGVYSAPVPAFQYADYALVQRADNGRLEEQLAECRRELGESPHSLALPFDRPRPETPTFRSAMITTTLPTEVTMALRAFSRRHGATPFMTILASFEAALMRWSGQDDFLVATPAANRRSPETEGVIGVFVNTVPVRARLTNADSFRELVRRVRLDTLRALARQDVPFERLVQELRAERQLNSNPLCQVMCAFQNVPAPNCHFDGLQILGVEAGVGASVQYDLVLIVAESGESLSLTCQFAVELFDAVAIERFVARLVNLTTSALTCPDKAIGELPILGVEEREQVLERWNATTRPQDFVAVVRAIEQQAAAASDAPAVLAAGEALTYRELNASADALAHRLRTLGVRADVRVGICMQPSAAFVVAVLAVMKAGGVYVPLNPEHPRERLAYMLSDAAVAVVLTHAPAADALPPCGAVVVSIGGPIFDDPHATPVACDVAPDDLAYIIYTSGTTGLPKGVMVPHRALANHMCWMRAAYELTSTDAVLQRTPITFDPSVWELFWPLMTGARLVMTARGEHRDVAFLAELIQRESITVAQFVPSLLDAFLDEVQPGQCASLRYLFCGGEALTRELSRRCFERLGLHPHNLYGPTETCIDATAWHDQIADAVGPVPLGHPISNTTVYLLDDHQQPAPIGAPGEIFIGGAGLARGYANAASLTAEKFVPDPFGTSAGARLYRTGDFARFRADGHIEFLGRRDKQIKIRGYRIELAEIESALRRCSGVKAAVVIPTQSARECALSAYVVAQTPFAPLPAKRQLERWLPRYMVPESIVAVHRFPLTPNGKIDVEALRQADLDGGSVDVSSSALNQTELRLLGIWTDVLGTPVSATTNFFDAGGHSLRAIRLVRRIQAELGVRLPVAALFRAPTVREQATELLERGAPRTFSPIVPLRRGRAAAAALVCVHPALGKAWPFLPLLPHLPSDIAVYGVEAYGSEPDATCLTSVQAMASAYITAMRTMDLAKPAAVVGYSMGGLIAYEIATQLARDGMGRPSVGLLDCPAPHAIAALADQVPESAVQALTQATGQPAASVRRWLETLASDVAAPSSAVSIDGIGDDLRALVVTYATNMRAARLYQPPPFDGRVVVIRAADTAERLPGGQDPSMGWEGVGVATIKVVETGGTHTTMLAAAHVAEVARAIFAECLAPA